MFGSTTRPRWWIMLWWLYVGHFPTPQTITVDRSNRDSYLRLLVNGLQITEIIISISKIKIEWQSYRRSKWRFSFYLNNHKDLTNHVHYQTWSGVYILNTWYRWEGIIIRGLTSHLLNINLTTVGFVANISPMTWTNEN